MKFKSSKDNLTITIYLTINFILVSYLFINGMYIVGLAASLWPLVFISSLFLTIYEVSNSSFRYSSGFTRKSIPISVIRSIKKESSFPVFFQSFFSPALSREGLRIYYNKYDDIFISPVDEKLLINYLTDINPSIIVEKL